MFFHDRDFARKFRKSALWSQNFFQDFKQICAEFLLFCDKFYAYYLIYDIKSNQGVSNTYQGISGGSFIPGNGLGWHCR
jgi:hypothetical protein